MSNHQKNKSEKAFNAIDVARRVILLEAQGLKTLSDQLGQSFSDTIDCLNKIKGRVILTGVGKSGHIARKIAATLASTGTPAYYVHPSEASHGDMGMITDQDAVIALSKSGETHELSDLTAYCRRYNIPLIAMTSSYESMLDKASHYTLLLPDVEEACLETRAPTTSTTLQIALGDALAIALLEKKGFTASAFHTFHPGGTLGSALKTVGDLMHTEETLPLVLENCSMPEALIKMSEKGFGCLGVITPDKNLVGIVTDGDLRRHMQHDLLQKKVSDIMTDSPKTAYQTLLASDALRVMTEGSLKITQLFIVKKENPSKLKKNKVIGLIHLHDLLRAGIV